MKTITKYVANDGSEWATEAEASNRDALHAAIQRVMNPLGHTPERVQSGEGWVHHDLETVMKAKDGILEVCRSFGIGSSFNAFLNPGRICHPFGIIGRILSDIGGPCGDAWSRICKIDEQGREHQQPYYAINGPLPTHVCVEDRRTV